MQAWFLTLLLSSMSWGQTNLRFEQNLGQTDRRAQFLARTRQATVFVTTNDTLFSLRGAGTTTADVRMRFGGASTGNWTPEQKTKATIASYVGPPSNWRDEIPVFERLRRKNVYPGIDLVYYGEGRDLEYDFELAPGSDVHRIRIGFSPGAKTKISSNGDLEVATAAGLLVQRRPKVFQDGAEVHAHYKSLDGGEYGIRLGAHNPRRPLKIDPVVTFASFYGGDGEDVITAVSGSAIAGYTNSIVFPGTSVPAAGGYDAFFATFGQSERIAYIGGSGDDKAYAVYSGNGIEYAFAGETNSPDFPVFARRVRDAVSPDLLFSGIPIQSKYGGGKSDGFFFWSTGQLRFDGLLVSSYLGGSGDDRILGIGLGPFNSLTLVGETDSIDFPVSEDAFQPALAGGTDGFFYNYNIFNSSIYSTYFGGSGNDRLNHTSNSFVNVVAGVTESDDFPLVNPLQKKRGGGRDAVIAFFQPLPGLFGFKLAFSTYLGGSGDDQINAIRSPGRMVAVGTTTSPDFPGTTPQTFKGGSDGFVSEFVFPSLTSPGGVTKTTYFGGSGNDEIRDALVAGTDLVIAGTTSSKDLPQLNPLQPSYGGGESDAFVALYSRDKQFLFSSYFGGTGKDEGVGVGLDSRNHWLVAGNSNSPSLPGSSSGPAGPSDGFFLQFSAPVLTLIGNYAALNAQTFTTIRGTILPEKTVRLRISSEDPSRLLLAMNGTTQGVAEIVTDWNGGAYIFQTWALTDSGVVDLIVSFDGVPQRRFPVTLSPTEVSLQFDNLGPFAISPTTVKLPSGATYPFSSTTFLTSRLADAPQFTAGVGYPRPGLPSQTLELISSDPEVLSFSPKSITLSTPVGIPFYQQNHKIGKAGTTIVTARVTGSLGTFTSAPVTVTYEAPRIQVALSQLAAGTISLAHVSLGTESKQLQVTLTSESPDAALLSVSSGSALSTSITIAVPITSGADFFVIGINAGKTARIRASVAGYEDALFEQSVTRPVYGLKNNQRMMLDSGEKRQVFINTFPSLLESFPVSKQMTFRAVSSDPQVVSVSSETFFIPANESNGEFTMLAQAPGTAYVEVFGPEGVDPDPGRKRVPVTVLRAKNPFALEDMTLGKDLQAKVTVSAPSFSAPFTLTSSDPSKLLISSVEDRPGAASASGREFWAQALSNEGNVTLTITNGESTATSKVNLVPSYAALNTNGDYQASLLTLSFFSISLYSQLPGSAMGIAHPPSFITNIQLLNRQPESARAGLGSVTIDLENSNPNVGTLAPIGSNSTIKQYQFTPLTIGETTLTARVTGPIPLSPRGSSVRISVRPVDLTIFGLNSIFPGNPIRLLKDTQSYAGLILQGIVGLIAAPIIRATSSDSSKVLISQRPQDRGVQSLETDQGLYLQALSDTGEAKVKITGVAMNELMVNVQLAPSAVVHGWDFPRRFPRQPSTNATPVLLIGEEAQLYLRLGDPEAGTAFGTARAGISVPVHLEVVPSGLLNLSATDTMIDGPPISVTALKPGRATIRITTGDGTAVAPTTREIAVDVTAP